ncbi:MAG: hypothetical protein ACREP6_09500 [Candidatus Binataceae bacterium]
MVNSTDDKAARVRMMAAGAGLELTEAEIAALANPLCDLIDATDSACMGFALDAPEPLMCPRSHQQNNRQTNRQNNGEPR